MGEFLALNASTPPRPPEAIVRRSRGVGQLALEIGRDSSPQRYDSSVASSVISVLSSFEMGQPALAMPDNFSKAA